MIHSDPFVRGASSRKTITNAIASSYGRSVFREGCRVHAYVLMTNHVHLLKKPSAQGQVSRVMQSLGRRYVRYINDRYRRTGTLWEGRYKSCLVDSESYLLRCYRYIELNPVRARMTIDPGDYPWSSYLSNGMGREDALLYPHANSLALGTTPATRHEVYRALVAETVVDDDLELIRHHFQRQHALGPDRFRTAIEAQLARRAGPAKIGRPRKDSGAPKSAL